MRLSVENLQRPGLCHSLNPAVAIQLAIDGARVRLDCVQLQVQPFANFTIGQPFRNELQYFNFALAQGVGQVWRRLAR